MFRLLSILMLLSLFAFQPAQPTAAQTEEPTEEMPADSRFRVVGYFISWGIYERQYFVTDVQASMLTHLNYAFANISDEGEVVVGDPEADTDRVFEGDDEDAPFHGNFNQLLLLKEQYPHLQTLISVGGWTWSGKFSDVALTPESREKFAKSARKFMVDYGFDGVDLDWEYPTGGGDVGNTERPEDIENFPLLLEAVRAELDAQGEEDGRHYLLTIAAGSGADAYNPLDWERISASLDFVNLMAYDMSGGWSSVTGFGAPLYDSTANPPEETSADTAVQDLLALGVPADKLVLGMPFYGHSWDGVSSENNGLHQPFENADLTAFDYRSITSGGYLDTMTRYWDETAQVPWLYTEANDGLMITYEDPASIKLKTSYAVENNLGGVMFWELTNDNADSDLLKAVHSAISK
jgi:chitinase